MFNNWSIKSLLQFWAGISVVAVIIMALMANYAHSLIESSRQVLSEQLLPVGDSSRRLSSVINALDQRQRQLLASDNPLQLAQITQRNAFEQRFEQNWLRLSPLFSEASAARQEFDSLFSFYQDFLMLDSELSAYKERQLLLSAQLHELSQQFGRQTALLQQQIERLRDRLASSQADSAQRLLTSLQRSVIQMAALNDEVFSAARDEQLAQLRQQQQALSQRIQQQLSRLQSDVTAPTAATLLATIAENLGRLLELSSADAGLIELHQQQLLTEALLAQTEQSAISVLKVMSDKINQIADIVGARTHEIVSLNQQQANQTRWWMVVLSILLSVLMIVFAWRLLRSIESPMTAIRESVHALAGGHYDTRMPLGRSSNELALLARDFNLLAENTQQTISALDEARLSLESRREHIQAILNGVPEAILTLTEQGTIIDVNPAAEAVFGATLEQLSGRNLLPFFGADTGIDSMTELARRLEQKSEFDGTRLDGSPLSMWLSLSHIDSAGADSWVCVISDVTAWKQADRRLQQLTIEQDAILENAIIGIAFIRDRRFVRVNYRFEQLFGIGREQLIGRSTLDFYPNKAAYEQFGEQAYSALTSGDSYEAQLELVRASGDKFWCAISGKAIKPEQPMDGTIWLFEDVTKQRENEEYLTRLASVDGLTGLPNRNVFNDRVDHAIHRAQRSGGRLAVFFLDLDHFKMINDSLGHRAGDMLLKAVASRIKSCLREGDTVARLGGDEFTLLLEEVRSAEYVGKVAEKVIKSMSQPYSIENTEVTISPSIGISLYPADGRDGDMLIRNADAAMYHAKKLGRNNFQFYSLEMNAEAAERLLMETALRRAVEQNELYLHYQAQYDLASGRLVGAEALLRWHNADWGHVSPARFVPILEDTGLIGLVGERILSQACDTYLELRDDLPADFVMAVNLSGRQFKGGNLAGDIRRLLTRSGMPAANLELEITESMLMEDTQLATLTLSELSQLGISLAIDDFGTGYSSLSYLKQFPLNVLKIDSEFIRDLASEGEDAAIVDAIMAMSASLGLTVVAEGVETQQQLDYLKQHHCQRAQGYLLSRPLDKADFSALVRQQLTV